MSAFGLEIKRLREDRSLTQKALADAVGISQPTIANVEKGKNPGVSVDTLFRLSDALGVPVEHWRDFLVAMPEQSEPGKKRRK